MQSGRGSRSSLAPLLTSAAVPQHIGINIIGVRYALLAQGHAKIAPPEVFQLSVVYAVSIHLANVNIRRRDVRRVRSDRDQGRRR